MSGDTSKLIICITGASSGIGRELTEQLINRGHTVIAIARREELLRELSAKVANANFHYYVADVSSFDQLKKVRADLFLKQLLPNVVICGASIYKNDTEPKFNTAQVKEIMNINFFGAVNSIETFIPDFLRAKQGHFICLSSIASRKPSLRGTAYPASKAAVGMLFRGLNLKYQNLGINFSTIYLGPVETDMWGGKSSFIVAKPNKIAAKIIRLITKPRSVSFIPFLSTGLSHLSLLIPDRLYARLSSYLFTK